MWRIKNGEIKERVNREKVECWGSKKSIKI